MSKTSAFMRTAIGAVGGVILIASASAAVAAEVGDGEVDVSVDITAVEPAGALTMSVASGSTTLTEVVSENTSVRQFDGVLPTVTVTDDRDETPEGVYWYVTGQASPLTSTGNNTIEPGYLGWAPNLLTEGDGQVASGDQVDTVLDGASGGEGLVGEELLALSLDSGEAAEVGTWQANANLFLKTPISVEPGVYSGTITLTLWEDAL